MMVPRALSFSIFLMTFHAALSNLPEEIIKKCQKETGFEGTFPSINFGESSSVPKEQKCFLACTMEKQDAMKDDGTISKEMTKASIEKMFKGNEEKKKKLIKAMDECFAEVKLTSNKCDNAFEFIKCKKNKLKN